MASTYNEMVEVDLHECGIYMQMTISHTSVQIVKHFIHFWMCPLSTKQTDCDNGG